MHEIFQYFKIVLEIFQTISHCTHIHENTTSHQQLLALMAVINKWCMMKPQLTDGTVFTS